MPSQPVSTQIFSGPQFEGPGAALESVESTTIHTSEFQGPLPPPAILAAFARIDPGLPNRIVSMAERAQSHSHLMDLNSLEVQRDAIGRQFDAVKGDRELRKRGQTFAFVLAVLCIVLGGVFVAIGRSIEGTTLAGVPLVGLVAVFISGRALRREPQASSSDDQDPSRGRA